MHARRPPAESQSKSHPANAPGRRRPRRPRARGSDPARRPPHPAPPLRGLPRLRAAGGRARPADGGVPPRGGKSGPAIVPGKPDESLLIKRIRAGEMPPRDAARRGERQADRAGRDRRARRAGSRRARPRSPSSPTSPATTPDPLVTDKDRDFWAFRPPRAQAPPRVANAARVRNPIDAFVLARSSSRKGLTLRPGGRPADPAPPGLLRSDRPAAGAGRGARPSSPTRIPGRLREADRPAARLAALRRALGPATGSTWPATPTPRASASRTSPRPHAWRYRDYVIRSFNADKPYDRFLLEQLAGDELADYEHGRRRSRRSSTTTWSPPASCAWPPTPPGPTSPASSPTASR